MQKRLVANTFALLLFAGFMAWIWTICGDDDMNLLFHPIRNLRTAQRRAIQAQMMELARGLNDRKSRSGRYSEPRTALDQRGKPFLGLNPASIMMSCSTHDLQAIYYQAETEGFLLARSGNDPLLCFQKANEEGLSVERKIRKYREGAYVLYDPTNGSLSAGDLVIYGDAAGKLTRFGE
jgi:hypothetical protein